MPVKQFVHPLTSAVHESAQPTYYHENGQMVKTSNNRRLEIAFDVTRLFVFCPTQEKQIKQAQANLDPRLFLIRPSKIHRPIDRRQVP